METIMEQQQNPLLARGDRVRVGASVGNVTDIDGETGDVELMNERGDRTTYPARMSGSHW
jgi:hypothetical protein